MTVAKIERKRITVSLPIAAYNSLEVLSQKEGLSVHEYTRRLVQREILTNHLPLYDQGENLND